MDYGLYVVGATFLLSGLDLILVIQNQVVGQKVTGQS